MKNNDLLPAVDLHNTCLNLKKTVLSERIDELAEKLPSVAFTAVGGIPFKLKEDGSYSWCGRTIDKKTLRENILEGLGASAVLTYTNPNNKSLLDLGEICNSLSHFWAYHWITVSIVFSNHSKEVELAFARDCRFRLSWTIGATDGKVFVATAGIKEWLDFTKHSNDKSFDNYTRIAMSKAGNLIKELISNE